MIAGTSGAVVHVKLPCPVGRHWFLKAEDENQWPDSDAPEEADRPAPSQKPATRAFRHRKGLTRLGLVSRTSS